jgi:hypothetical protein
MVVSIFFIEKMVFISWVKIIFEPLVCIVVTSIVVKKLRKFEVLKNQ